MDARYADTPSTEVAEWIDAEREAVWPHVVGLDAMVAGSPELQACSWLDEPGPGARFTGTNHREVMGEWTTTCLTTAFDVGRAFGWDVYDNAQAIDDGGLPMASWRFTLTAERGGTRLAQWVRMGPGRSGVSRVIEATPERESAIVAYRLGTFERGMRANLAEIKRRAQA